MTNHSSQALLSASDASALLNAHALALGRNNLPGLTIGFELELMASRNTALVDDYRPSDEEPASWLALSSSQRIHRIIDWKNQMHPRASRGEPIVLKQITSSSGYDPRFASELTLEATGVFEMHTAPFTSLSGAADFLSEFVSRYGAAQSQAHVVFKRRPLPGFATFSQWESDRSQILNLTADHILYAQDQKRLPAFSFVSAFLPPVDSAILNLLQRDEWQLSQPSHQEVYYKFINSPVIRHGRLYGDESLVGIELRQWDIPTGNEGPLPFHMIELMAALERTVSLLMSPEPFAVFDKECVSAPASEMGAWMFLSKKEHFEKTPSPSWQHWTAWLDTVERLIKLTNGRNHRSNPRTVFLYPFRNWYNHPSLNLLSQETRHEVRLSIVTAVANYTQEICKIASLCADSGPKLDTSHVLPPLRIALARWAYESQLIRAIKGTISN